MFSVIYLTYYNTLFGWLILDRCDTAVLVSKNVCNDKESVSEVCVSTSCWTDPFGLLGSMIIKCHCFVEVFRDYELCDSVHCTLSEGKNIRQ